MARLAATARVKPRNLGNGLSPRPENLGRRHFTSRAIKAWGTMFFPAVNQGKRQAVSGVICP